LAVWQTENVFSDFERRINEILPVGQTGDGAAGDGGGRQRGPHHGHSPAPGSAMAAAAAAQAETGSLIHAATGELACASRGRPARALIPRDRVQAPPLACWAGTKRSCCARI
jgi:hypothetical protein